MEEISIEEKEHNERIEKFKKINDSTEFQAQIKYIRRLSSDAALLLKLCHTYSFRAPSFSKQSLIVQSTDDLSQSIMAGWILAEEGLINPIKRELRYIIESCIKYLYTDQQCFGKSIEDRTSFLRNIGSSIDVRNELQLGALHIDDQKQFINELYDVYRNCCAYVHVSPTQVTERLEQAERGGALGYKTITELRQLGRLMFRVFDMALTLYFHGYDLSMTGDVFVGVLDEKPEWSFHKGKYVAIVSAYYDYKHERNIKKYGESRPWEPEGWPPKKL